MLKLAIFNSSNSKLVTWPAGENIQLVSLFGSCRLDLRNVDLPPGSRLGAWTAFGSVSIIVSPTTEVHESGVALLGSFHAAPGRSASGGTLRLSGLALFGSVSASVAE